MSEPETESAESNEWQCPTEEQIRQRAYELSLERQRQSGGPLDDWLEAEAELMLSKNQR